MGLRGRAPDPQRTQRNAELPDDLVDLLKELGEDEGYVELYRQNRYKPTQWEYLGRHELAVFSLEYVKDTYGGGHFRADIRDGNASFIKRPKFKIAGEPRDPETILKEREREGGGGGSEVAELRRELASLREMMVLQASQPRDDSRFDKLLELTLPTLLAALLERRDDGVQAKDMVKLFAQGLDMGKDLGGGGDQGYGSVVKELGAPLLQMLGTVGGGTPMPTLPPGGPTAPPPPAAPPPPPPVPIVPSGPVANAPPAAPPPPPPAPAPPPSVWDSIAPQVPRLVQLAAAEQDAEAWAVVVAGGLGDDDVAIIDELMQGEDWPGSFFQRFPQTAPLRSWFETFFSELEGALFDVPEEAQEAVAVDPRGGPGNPPHGGGDAAPGSDPREGPGGPGGGGQAEPGRGSPQGNGVGGPPLDR